MKKLSLALIGLTGLACVSTASATVPIPIQNLTNCNGVIFTLFDIISGLPLVVSDPLDALLNDLLDLDITLVGSEGISISALSSGGVPFDASRDCKNHPGSAVLHCVSSHKGSCTKIKLDCYPTCPDCLYSPK